MPAEAAVAGSVATLCKLAADFLKLRKDAKSGEESKTVRDYVEWCRRQDHAETLDRIDLVGERLAGFEQLLHTLGGLVEGQAAVVLDAIRDGNLALLSAVGVGNASVHAKLDQIVHLLGVQPRRLFRTDYESWRDAAVREFEGRYLEHARVEFGRLEMLGVPAARDLHQQLDVAYVNLELGALADGGGGTGRADHVLPCSRRLTVRGPAGSGKTTLLRWVAFQCATAARPPAADPGVPPAAAPWQGGIPLFVPLRKLSGADQGKPDEKKLHEYAFDAGVFRTAPDGWLATVFEEGRAVLLLDGVDEIPGAVRQNFWNWLRELLKRHGATRVFVTSRPLSADAENDTPQWRPPADFNHAELKDLSRADRTVFIRNWHDAVKAVQPDPRTHARLDASRDQLLGKLDDRAYAHVRDLCKNPLTAGLICALYWRELKLPETRRDLYERSCDMLMVVRDETRDIKPNEPFQGVRKADRFLLVQCLAWEMMQNVRADSGQNIEVPQEDARAWLKIHLPRCEAPELRGADAKEVLDELLIQRSGLVRVPTKGVIDFHHRSFQEYLAACAAANLKQLGNLVEKAGNDQWRDTIVLAANTHVGGVTFGRELIAALLKAGQKGWMGGQRRECVALAAACLVEAINPPPELRRAVEERVHEIVPPRSPAEADVLAVGGEAVLPYLAFERLKARDRGVKKVLLACVRAIALIGTDKARQMLLDPSGYRQAISTEQWLEGLAAFPNLTSLDLNEVRITEAEAKALAALTSLTDLNVSDSGISDAGVTSLATLKNLTSLDLSGANITDAGLEALAAFARLTRLGLRNIGTVSPAMRYIGITDAGMKGLAAIKSLTNLDLAGTRVTPVGAKELAELTNLAVLNMHNTGITDAGVRELAALTSLTSLDLSNTGVTDAGVRELAALTSLTTLGLGGTKVTDAGMKALAALTSLIRLDLSNTGVTDAGVRELAALTVLTTLDLRATWVTDAGVKALATLTTSPPSTWVAPQ